MWEWKICNSHGARPFAEPAGWEFVNLLRHHKSFLIAPLCLSVPVSRPVLTLRSPGAQAAVGDLLELHCEALRGSPPILYQFYHEDVTLGNSSAPSGGGASFNLSLTAEHSGNYSCEANNGLGAQCSEAVPVSISGPDGYRRDLMTAGVLWGLFGVLGFTGVALLLYALFHKISGCIYHLDSPYFAMTFPLLI
ncbi:Fc receptor like 2 [Homo sapiens]|uniref:Isoform 3 of Fc receptor-like protein 2 n=1 Tax=Homo sapiens TaxID=9606 RepID=Q96LA5-3|nr:SH2 domain-containing phosphatase anchor protein 1b [Homo sapiens]EAW52868.1 Fc receptor-like 2, isoform CRA_e [Homo sapiens]KAI2519794.1 Fc receptor like 2 [Homo sapiens]KAI4083321.1 Fc receptor like 2 [Homo sapiens]